MEEVPEARGRKDVKLRTDIHMEADGSIIIDRIIVTGCAAEDRSAVQNYIEEETGVSPNFQAGA